MRELEPIRALFLNASLKPSPEPSHTGALMEVAIAVLARQGVDVDQVRVADHDIPPGVEKDMRAHGRAVDDWPAIQARVMAADILVIGTPIWLGERSSLATRVVERLYGWSGEFNERGQSAYYGRVGGCVVTGNEDGIKHCAAGILYALQHLGFTIPPRADAGWIGEAGPGPSYGDALDGGGGAGNLERLHPAQHRVHGVEPAAHGAHPESCGGVAGDRQRPQGVARGRAFRPPQPRVSELRGLRAGAARRIVAGRNHGMTGVFTTDRHRSPGMGSAA